MVKATAGGGTTAAKSTTARKSSTSAKAKTAIKKKSAAKKKPSFAAKNKKHIEEIVEWAHWFHRHGRFMPYTETAARSGWLNQEIGHYPIDTDCSGFVTLCYAWAGAFDPNGLNTGVFKPGHWTQLGYTGTILQHAAEHGHIISVSAFADHAKAKLGDLLVVGPGTGDHVMLVVEEGEDPLCVSHGSEGVWLVRASQDQRTPHRYCRFIKAA